MIITSFVVAALLQYAFIYAVTRFQTGQSTSAQRGWMLAWLLADQVSALGTLLLWIVSEKRWTDIKFQAAKYASTAVLILPAIGGLVVVGQMFVEDSKFGVCPAT